jgi:hypothetical protein
MLLMIDNYDSFTYNLVQYFGELGEDVRVYRNDEITLDQIDCAEARTTSWCRPAVFAQRGRRVGAADQGLCRQVPHPRRLPRPPEHRCGLRRRRGAPRW